LAVGRLLVALDQPSLLGGDRNAPHLMEQFVCAGGRRHQARHRQPAAARF